MYSVLTNTWEAGLLGPEESTAVLPSTAPLSAASPNLALACWGSTSPKIMIDCFSVCSGASWLVGEPPGGLSHAQPTNHPFYLPTRLLSPVGPPEQALEALCPQVPGTNMAFSLTSSVFSKTAKEINCYGIALDYLIIYFINSACGDSSHTSLSITHYIWTP